MLSPNETEVEPLIEHRFLTAGWRDPKELSRVCESLNLRAVDFADRLVAVTVDYLRDCATRGAQPSLTEAVDVLASRAMPDAIDELYFILQDTELSPGDSLTDLALAVQQGADERTNELCRMLAREAFKAVSHTFNCPNCIRCSQAKPSHPRLGTIAPRARKAWRLQYESANG